MASPPHQEQPDIRPLPFFTFLSITPHQLLWKEGPRVKFPPINYVLFSSPPYLAPCCGLLDPWSLLNFFPSLGNPLGFFINGASFPRFSFFFWLGYPLTVFSCLGRILDFLSCYFIWIGFFQGADMNFLPFRRLSVRFFPKMMAFSFHYSVFPLSNKPVPAPLGPFSLFPAPSAGFAPFPFYVCCLPFQKPEVFFFPQSP